MFKPMLIELINNANKNAKVFVCWPFPTECIYLYIIRVFYDSTFHVK